MDWLVQDQRCPNQEDWNQKVPDQMKAAIIELYRLRKWKAAQANGRSASIMESLVELLLPDPVEDPALPKRDASSANTYLQWVRGSYLKANFQKAGG